MNMLIKNQSQAIQILTDVANILDTYTRIGNVWCFKCPLFIKQLTSLHDVCKHVRNVHMYVA